MHLCALWAKYRKSSIRHFNVSSQYAYRLLHNLPMRCRPSASFMFANAVIDNCTMRVRKCIVSLLGRLTTSTNVIVQSALNSDVDTTSALQQRWIKALYTCS